MIGHYSQGCIDLLAEKFNVDVNPGMSDEDKAVYESFRALIEDRLIPMVALERFYWLKVSDKHFLSCSPVATTVYSLPDLSTVKKLFLWLRKTFEIWGWWPRISNICEITRTIYSNSKRSEQFFVTECFSKLFL